MSREVSSAFDSAGLPGERPIPSPETLIEGQRQVFERLSTGAPLSESLTALIGYIETVAPDVIGSVLLLDRDGVHLRHGAAPSLPEEYTRAIDGAPIGPAAGSCGTAAFRRTAVFVSDIDVDPLWADYRELALAHGLRACWSTPILNTDGRVLGTLALYRRVPGQPERWHHQVIALATPLAAVAIGQARAYSALRESEQRFRAFMTASPAIAWVTDAQGRHVDVNPAWEREFNIARADVLGRTAFDLVSAEKAAAIRASDEQVLRTGQPIEIFADETEIGGRTVYWHLVKFPFQSHTGEWFLGGMAINRTRRQQAELALKASEERYRATLDNTLEGCQLLDFDWRYLYLNEAASRHNRRPNSELLGRTMMEAWPGIEVSHVFQLLRRCMNERIALHEETEFQFADGTSAWFDVRCQPVPEGIFVLSIDITDRHHAEVALRDLNATLEQKVAERTAELEHARQRAESADRLKSAFLATMSHELRTPLNSIIGFTGIVLAELAGPLTAEQAKQLGLVRSSARHLLDLINDVLDLSKIEADQLVVQREPVDLADAIARVVATAAPQAEAKGLALRTQLPEQALRVIGDQRRVDQILINLIGNALKFTDRGAVEVVASVRPTTIRVDVRDSGIGIRPADLPQLFQPFRQVDTGLSRSHDGTGLGLVICRRLAGLMGGTVTVSSEWGRGSTFTMELPREPLT